MHAWAPVHVGLRAARMRAGGRAGVRACWHACGRARARGGAGARARMGGLRIAGRHGLALEPRAHVAGRGAGGRRARARARAARKDGQDGPVEPLVPIFISDPLRALSVLALLLQMVPVEKMIDLCEADSGQFLGDTLWPSSLGACNTVTDPALPRFLPADHGVCGHRPSAPLGRQRHQRAVVHQMPSATRCPCCKSLSSWTLVAMFGGPPAGRTCTISVEFV